VINLIDWCGVNGKMSVASSPFGDHPNNHDTPRRSKSRDDELREFQEQYQAIKYQLSLEQEARERDRLHHERAIFELEQKVTTEGKRADSLESDQAFLFNKQKEASEALHKAREAHNQEKQRLEQSVRQLRQQLQAVESTYEDHESRSRQTVSFQQRTIDELTLKNTNLQVSIGDISDELTATIDQLRLKQAHIIELEEELNTLKAETVDLKLKENDLETLDMVKRQLSEQLSLVVKLEDQVAARDSQVKQLIKDKRLIDIVEEEKSVLRNKLRIMTEFQQQAAEMEIKIIELEEDRKKWVLFLEKNDKFSSPEEIVRALMHTRIENVNLLEKISRLEADLSASSTSSSLVKDLKTIKARYEETNNKLDIEAQQRARWQRQRQLGVQEAQFLRQQLKAYEAEESVLLQRSVDAHQATRISELESLVEQYKIEMDTLSKELSDKEGLVVKLNSPLRGPPQSTSNQDERLGEALRKNNQLHDELEHRNAIVLELTKELNVLKQQKEYTEQATVTKHRILELRDNPTARYEAIKLEMLAALKKENEALLEQLNGTLSAQLLVPISSLERVREESKDLERIVKEQNKRFDRLKEVFSKKSLEFREAVYSLLGYKLDMLPNRKVRATSVFSTSDADSFTFIPDPKAKNKFIGVEEGSPLVVEFENLITFWVKERHDIPCLLSALNLELYDRTTKANRF
jgi:mitotic spindle assembly checkpoint protein MAD1